MIFDGSIKFSRVWAMPSEDTFSIPPITKLVSRYLKDSICSVDPFARNSELATYTNDLNPKTKAHSHRDAVEFLTVLADDGMRCCDLLILDPPYSPRQISECYRESGIPCGMQDTQNAALYKRVKDAAMPILAAKRDCTLVWME